MVEKDTLTYCSRERKVIKKNILEKSSGIIDQEPS